MGRDDKELRELTAVAAGWRAITALAKVFGDDKLVPLSVGKRFSL